MKLAIVIGLAAVGLAFSLSGVVGILRMPDLYSRIQCATKTITMGALPILVAVVIGEAPLSPYGSRALLVAALLLVVNPTASHALARAAYKAGVPMWPGSVRDDAAAKRQERERRAADGGRPGGAAPRGGSARHGRAGERGNAGGNGNREG